ncbi:hypothetical protein FRACYDRAFT_234804 [Fragilariopsis cylindrus CCMP1102]|uniref:Tudor domain-containing protein n=1 Tax=Fragilariopsis cylindrus CCMP1102 TaxID=635003 RepID=A0A1E7FST6_9STRA|nr:hypothetical protein FRACYDRAFT_234804 [Fragilariopsis cylindrus CCMP1102]|eukprot:OEU21177.1 hypothetical protein FRACYDRAFT_234804 [Fragilariopsis cylindrus CCMP1102]
MDSPCAVSGSGSSNTSNCYNYNTKNSRPRRRQRQGRGIRNVSKVSCHVACAIQILCNAIPTVRSALYRIVVEEEEEKRKEKQEGNNNDGFHDDNDFDFDSLFLLSTSSQPLMRELVDFVRLDPNQVGDATTSLSCLLQLLSKEGGSIWKNILNVSIWEGETRQVLEGRRPISDIFAATTTTCTTTCTTASEKITTTTTSAENLLDNYPNDRRENDSDETGRINLPHQRRFLQRIKKSAKNKSMSSPLVLKFRHDVNPDSSLHQQNTDDAVTNDDRPQFSVKRFRRSLLDRYIVPVTQVQTTEADREGEEDDDIEGRDLSSSSFFRFDYVHVPLTLNTSSFAAVPATKTTYESVPNSGVTTYIISSNDHDKTTENESFHRQHPSLSSSTPTGLVLQGAIVQVIEIDDTNDVDDDDWEGGHSITLLRNKMSWVLIDDDVCQPISENRAIRMMGGVVEDKIRGGGGGGRGKKDYTYFAASLLVYSIPEEEDNEEYCYNEEWKQHEDKIVSSLKETIKETKAKSENLIGKRLKVKWAKGKLYAGTILSYDQSTGKHRVKYDDGGVKEYVLAKKTIEWIDEGKP